MVFGRGDFNDIRGHEEKRGRRRRLESSFRVFNNFIAEMVIEEKSSVSSMVTWANNRVGEGFVEEKLDRLFGASNWLLKHPRAIR